MTPIRKFILLSAALHAGLFFAQTNTLADRISPAGRTLVVKLSPASNLNTSVTTRDNAVAKQTTRPSQTIVTQHKTMIEPIRPDTTTQTITQQTGATTNKHTIVTNQQPARATQLPLAIDSQVLAKQMSFLLKQALTAYFDYPLLARHHGWQGEVKIRLRVTADGQLSQFTIAQSSGYAILDRAALHSLQQIPPLSEARQWLNDDYYDTVLPIHYRLIDS